MDFWTTLKRVQQFLTNSPSTGQAANYVQNPKRFKVVADPDTNELVVLHTIEIQQNGNRGFVRGTGVMKDISISDPAAGTEISVTVPAGKVWRIQSVRFKLATSAAVANRRVNLQFSFDGVLADVDRESSFTQTAGETSTYSWSQTEVAGASTTAGFLMDPIPIDYILPAGGTIQTVTAASLDVGDQYSAVHFIVEEFTP